MSYLRNGEQILKSLGLDVRRGLQTLKKKRRLRKDSQVFQSLGGSIEQVLAVYEDGGENAGVSTGHYFHQDLLVAQYIFESNPKRHVDIGSRIDGFVAHVASYRRIEVIDIRPLESTNHANLIFIQKDLMSDETLLKSDSVSCLHAIEHFGLGRYGDELSPDGHQRGLINILRMLEPQGTLYISFPIGRMNTTVFNAHRIFHPTDILNWPGVKENLQLISFDYVDDLGNLNRNHNLVDSVPELKYGCGIYRFIKK